MNELKVQGVAQNPNGERAVALLATLPNGQSFPIYLDPDYATELAQKIAELAGNAKPKLFVASSMPRPRMATATPTVVPPKR